MIGTATLAAVAIAACGGDDEASTTAASGEGLTGDALVSCLQAAGYDAAVDNPVTGLDAERPAGGRRSGPFPAGSVHFYSCAERENASAIPAASATIERLIGLSGRKTRTV